MLLTSLNKYCKILLAALMLCLSCATQGADVAVGQQLPPIAIADRGELVLVADEVDYQAWSSAQLLGKPAYLQHVAARMAAGDLNQPFSDALEALKIPAEQMHVAAVVNVSDAVWGTSGFVAAELKAKKKRYPNSMMVHDSRGQGLEQWGVAAGSSAIMILAPDGTVLFFKDGAMDSAEISQAIAILQTAIAENTAATVANADHSQAVQ